MLAIVRAGIDACAPARLLPPVATELKDEARRARRVRVIAAGKAASGMAATAVDLLGAGIVAEGAIIAPEVRSNIGALEGISAGHPAPDARSQAAGERALALARACGRDDLLLVLLSGGASALMAVPAAGLTLDDKRTTSGRLMRAGADIQALNAVRKHLSAIKGGLLAAACAGAVRTYLVSDVVTDELSAIASGPTVADQTTFNDALEALDRFGGRAAYPPPVVARLEGGARGEIPETPKPGDARLERSHATLVGGRTDAMEGAGREAAARGYHVEMLREPVTGDAHRAALAHADVVGTLRRAGTPTCVISSGETTVHVIGDGVGGRNLEFALGVATRADRLGSPFAAASAGTDGVDGPTDAAGAIVDGDTLTRARAAGLDSPERVFARNDTYTFFKGLDDLIRTGPTGTNVGDLQVFLLA